MSDIGSPSWARMFISAQLLQQVLIRTIPAGEPVGLPEVICGWL